MRSGAIARLVENVVAYYDIFLIFQNFVEARQDSIPPFEFIPVDGYHAPEVAESNV